jgi:hypothetical protein
LLFSWKSRSTLGVGEVTATRVFISYRREDTGGYAGRLYDQLAASFGEQNVFMDIDTLGPGVDFEEEIRKAIDESDVVLALIGRRWLETKGQGGRRLDEPGDFLRRELGAALGRGRVVIPVLVQGATMPPSSELPSDIGRLARLNAFELSDRRWKLDVEELIERLESRQSAAGRTSGRTGERDPRIAQAAAALDAPAEPVSPRGPEARGPTVQPEPEPGPVLTAVPPDKPPLPRSLMWARLILYAQAVILGPLGLLVVGSNNPLIFLPQTGGGAPEQDNANLALGIGFVLVATIAVVFAVRMRARRRQERAMCIAFEAVVAVASLFELVTRPANGAPGSVYGVALGVVLGIPVAELICLTRNTARAWFTA